MKYFFDTEFIEGFDKPLFCKKRHYIDLISIGIVCEDGRSYYAISTEFNPKDAGDWVKDKVISKLPDRFVDVMDSPRRKHESSAWKSNTIIASDIIEFVGEKPEFYGYYCDYDWVLLCSLFGRMIDLPKGFPMYCIDLKQELDLKAQRLLINKTLPNSAQFTKEECVDILLSSDKYPKQENEHNALADAKWIYELYKFIQPLP